MKYSVLAFVALLMTISIISSCTDDDDCTEITWYEDADGDLLGNPNSSFDACEQPDGFVDNANDSDDTNSGSSSTVIDESFFNSSSLVSFSTVSCTLENGTSTTCYQLVFDSNPVDNGPYCPSTIDEIGGVGIYDGATNSGFQVMKKSLWEAMEADGYDIVDDEGNITIEDPGAGMGGAGAACLEATPDDDLILTFLIPTTPELLASPDQLDVVESIGVTLDGIPLTGDPPSVVQGPPGMGGGTSGGNIPSIDPCGGHMDPFGYYHLHFAPQEMNNVLTSYNITEISCTNFDQSETTLVGFAKDGFPIYASKDIDGTLPTDLDGCNGHEGVTNEYPDGTYHYHASSTVAPNVPPCLMGSTANNSFTFR